MILIFIATVAIPIPCFRKRNTNLYTNEKTSKFHNLIFYFYVKSKVLCLKSKRLWQHCFYSTLCFNQFGLTVNLFLKKPEGLE